MDSDESEDELYPIETIYPNRGGEAFIYNDPLLVTGVLRAIVTEDLEKIKELVSAGHSLNINDNNGNTPLHVAVIKNNLEILNYLATQKEIRINTRNFVGQTPLFVAVKYGHCESVKILVENGANVNLPDNEEVTPLHKSVQYPEIAHLLIKNGANVNVIDYSDDTPLHDAVAEKCLETVCMLLYYGADANALGGNNLTPFMKALITENFDIQEALFDYADDYNVTSLDDCSTLTLSLTHDNPYVNEIIKRGAEVNVAAFRACINIPNLNNFKLIWSNLTAEDAEDEDVDLMLIFYQLDTDYFDQYIDIIIENSESSLLQVLAGKSRSLSSLVVKCVSNGFITHDQFTKLTLLLLQYGYQMDSELIVEVFLNMGYCELFKILLFMDYQQNWTKYTITPRLIFDIHSDIITRCNELLQEGFSLINMRKFREDVIHSFGYWRCHCLLDIALNQFSDLERDLIESEEIEFRKYVDMLPKVPSLLELARDQTRKHIVSKMKFKTTSQYYTYINCLDLSLVYKKVLMFERKIYS